MGKEEYIVRDKALAWVVKNTVAKQGIQHTNSYKFSYPEVTGYYIPTLIRYGQDELAVQYAKWLCSIQKEDGSYFDVNDRAPYVFDTMQIVKGFLAIRHLYPSVDGHIQRACAWVLSNMLPNGRLTTPVTETWGNDRTCSELIHLYCIEPLREAGRIFGIQKYEEAASGILEFYLRHHKEQILNFSLLSHFYAYVVEGLLDMGEDAIAKSAMENLASYQKDDGSVPAYNNVNWICSTGLMQFALIWFRLGEKELGEKALLFATKLQNPSGGWYGSYRHPEYPDERNTYFPAEEISWANKFFLDALYFMEKQTGNK